LSHLLNSSYNSALQLLDEPYMAYRCCRWTWSQPQAIAHTPLLYLNHVILHVIADLMLLLKSLQKPPILVPIESSYMTSC